MTVLEDILELLSDGVQRNPDEISRVIKADLHLINEALAFLAEYNFVRRGSNGRYILDEEVKRFLDIQS